MAIRAGWPSLCTHVLPFTTTREFVRVYVHGGARARGCTKMNGATGGFALNPLSPIRNPLPFPSPVRGNFVRISRVNFSKANAFLPALLDNREKKIEMFSSNLAFESFFSNLRFRTWKVESVELFEKWNYWQELTLRSGLKRKLIILRHEDNILLVAEYDY